VELLKKNIHMNHEKSRASSQVTLEEDYNVSDSKPDVGKLIQKKANIKLDDMKVSTDHVLLTGALEVWVLYVADTPDRQIHRLESKIPFEEQMNLDGVEPGDNICLKWDVEDISVSLINSRKLSMKSLLSFNASVEELYDAQAAVEIHGLGDISTKSKNLELLQLSVQKKDILRVKDEIAIPSNKPNIQEMLWENVQLRGTDIRVLDGQLDIKGELFIFVLYAGDDENGTKQWLETVLPFQGTVDCPGCAQNMLANVEVSLASANLEVRPDYDGEERLVQVDVVLDLDIRLYEEEKVQILEDVYTPVKDLIPVTMEQVCESLVVKNFSKCRASDRMKMESSQPRMLQICHSQGEVKIDDTSVTENGIKVEGAVFITILYITSDDTLPYALMEGAVPFQHIIEVPEIDNDCRFTLQSELEQLSTTMIDSEELEVKVCVNLNAMVIRVHKEQCIIDVEEHDLDMKKLQELPGIVGYIVQADDSLWSIAKQYYTTPERIRELNEIEEEEVSPGTCLLVMKAVENLS